MLTPHETKSRFLEKVAGNLLVPEEQAYALEDAALKHIIDLR